MSQTHELIVVFSRVIICMELAVTPKRLKEDMEQLNRVSTVPFLANDVNEKTENSLYMFSVVKSDGVREVVSEKRLRRTKERATNF